MDADELRLFTKKICSLVIGAKDLPEMYGKLNRLRKNSKNNWQLLRAPTFVGSTLIAVLIRPRNDNE